MGRMRFGNGAGSAPFPSAIVVLQKAGSSHPKKRPPEKPHKPRSHPDPYHQYPHSRPLIPASALVLHSSPWSCKPRLSPPCRVRSRLPHKVHASDKAAVMSLAGRPKPLTPTAISEGREPTQDAGPQTGDEP